MTMRKFSTCFSAITVMLIFLQNHLVASLSPTPIHQKIALFQFKQSLNIGTPTDCSYYSHSETYEISSYPKTMNWSMSSDHCTWKGVSCKHETGHVIGLDLSCSQLEGAILPNSTLFQLSHLRFLNLSNNDFFYNQFPQEFGSFAKGLTHLNLSYTRFIGRVPSGISHLYKLVSLDLSGNNDAKLEDEAFKSILQNLTQLRVLNLNWVDIFSVLPVNLSTSLRVLSLRHTDTHGVLPQDVFHLPNIEVLALGGVETGLQAVVLPKVKWGSSGTLQHLHLRDINFNGGVIPDSIGFLDSLATLDLSDCNLSGPIPRSIGRLGQLTHLGLNYNNLAGPIPRSIGNLGQLTDLYLDNNDLAGPIPRSIGNLGQLTDLYLDNNNLAGPIPRSIGNLGQLTDLYLDNNDLNGPIPKRLANLTNLIYLFLSDNSFTGPFLSSIAHVKGLIELHLENNGFTGLLPTGLFNLPSLEELDLSNNGFTGQLYDFNSTKSQLKLAYLNNNSLYGPIPQSFYQLVNLTELDISSNNFSGVLDMKVFSFYQLVNLAELDLSSNNFSGVLDMKVFACLESLRILDLSSNNFIGVLDMKVLSRLEFLGRLDLSSNNFSGVLDMKVFSGLESLEILDLSHNSLLSVRSSNTTSIPPKLEELRLSSCNMKEFPHFSRDAEISMNWVDLSNNEIEGEIPHWIGSVDGYLNISHNRLTGGLEQLPWNNIQYLDLQSNKLNGSLPTLICNSSSLRILNLANNTLSGVLPICQTNLTSLSVFDLRNNNFQGNIPATLSNFRSLETINLNGNRLEGKIPSFAEFDYLQVLDLGNNQINDTFPQCLEALPNLQVLIMKSNKLHGLMNKSSKIDHPFPRLRIIDLSNNEFSGPLPATYIQNFKAMMIGDVNERKATYMVHDRDAAYYSDSTALVIKGVETKLVRILTLFTTIDVSRNNFEGKIPEITGKLVLLRYLNLSHNYLGGHIPTSIGKLSMLESLDLSFNQLEGEIPQQLTSMYTLARLNLSCNKLDGQIPKGSQFNTFDNDSYVGNLGLCGFPLSKECEHDTEMQKEGEDDDYFFSGFTWEAVVIGYGCGVVPAFIIGNLMLLAGKPKWFAGIIARELGLKIRRMEIRMRMAGQCGFPLSKECEHDSEAQKEDKDDDYFFSDFTWEAVMIEYSCRVVPAFIIGLLMLLAGKPKGSAGIIARELGLKIGRIWIHYPL